ncbi:MAG: hypothetical protein DRQ55_15835 [Planctomycetota bacterium]|nr:MAG: hypothetical protein DRQ55_15835 [Planctomycetota bacterium]
MIRSLVVLLVALLCGACVIPDARDGRDTRGAEVNDSVRRGLSERAAHPDQLLSYADRVRPDIDDPRLAAELELAVARALRELGRPLSAKLSLQRAWAHVEPSAAGLGGEIQLEWAELEHRTAQRDRARTRWQELLRRPGLSASSRDQALAGLAASYEMSGDAASARAWRRKLGSGSALQLAAARRRLQTSKRPAPQLVVRANTSIPTDPRELLAEIHPRASWGAQPLRPNHGAMDPIQAITVHHTAMARPRPGLGGATMRSIQSYHQDVRNWADIGYHFLIDPEGGIWEGRALRVQGAHAGSDKNRGNVGVCLMGNFDEASVPAAQAQALDRLLDTLRARFSLGASDVFPHSRFKLTACPGRSLSVIVGAYRGA